MPSYTDYQDILLSYSFTGGAGQNAIPNSGSDVRAEVDKDGNDIYQFYYYALTSLSDINNLGYYSTGNREYTQMPSGNDPSLSATQLSILSSVLTSSTYGVSFSDVAMVNFNSSSTSNANIILGATTNGGSPSINSNTSAYELDYSKGFDELKHGDIWLNEDATTYWDSDNKGSSGYWAMMHELGHSLGLSHTDGTPSIDSQKYSIMSYNFLAGMNPGIDPNTEVAPFGLQLLDIAAIQEIYGRNWDTRDTDTTYSKVTAFASSRPNDAFIYTIWDGGGNNDEIDVSGYTNTQGAIVDLRQGEFSSVGYNAEGGAAVDNLAIAYHTIIEDATGTAYADILIGNAWDNALVGGAGNDRIFGDGASVALDSLVSQIKGSGEGYGSNDGNYESGSGIAAATDGSGDDTLEGGEGDDILYGGAGDDTYVYNLGDDHDTIYETGAINLSFGTGITEANTTYSEDQNDLVMTFSDGGTIRLKNYLIGEGTIDNVDYNGTALNRPTSGGTINGTNNSETILGSDLIDTIHAMDGNDFIDGGSGGDRLWGGAGNDFIFSGNGGGTSILYGESGNDVLVSGQSTGRNFLYGGDGNDVLYAGNTGTYIGDRLNGGAGSDTLYGNLNKASELWGDEGDDTIYAVGFATIYGGSGTNYLYSGVNGAEFSLMEGNDYIYGNSSAEAIYTYSTYGGAGSFGNNIIYDNGSNTSDSIRTDIYDNIYYDEFKIETDSNDLVLTGIGNETGSIRIIDHLVDATPIQYVATEGGATLDISDFSAWTLGTVSSETVSGTSGDDIIFSNGGTDTLVGNNGNDQIFGGAGNDTIKGGLGSDLLYGGSGNDTYFYDTAAEFNNDTIRDYAGNDTIQFGTGISFSDVSFDDSHTGGDLYIDVGSNSLTLSQQKNLYNPTSYIEYLQFFNGYTFVLSNYQNWNNGVTNHAGTGDDEVVIGTSELDTLSGAGGADYLIGLDGNDILDGGSGDDILEGGSGNDTYLYDSGLDTFEDTGDTDTILFGSGVSVYDLTIADSGTNDTLITLNSGTDEILLVNNINANTDLHFESVAFDSGLVLDLSDYSNWVYGTSSAETINGDSSVNTILGDDGNDYIYGNAGNDQIDGGDGNDKIWGGDGDDYIFGGDGLDLLRGEDGNDTIYASSGNNTIYGGDGNDVIYGGSVSGFDNMFGDAGDDIIYATGGNDYLRGGTGSDTFVLSDINYFSGTDAAAIKAGFDVSTSGDNDVLDIKDIIDYDSGTGTLSEFVTLTDNGTNTLVSVDTDGTGSAYSWTVVAIIQSVTGVWTDAADMVSQNNLIVE